mgnify:FL=1
MDVATQGGQQGQHLKWLGKRCQRQWLWWKQSVDVQILWQMKDVAVRDINSSLTHCLHSHSSAMLEGFILQGQVNEVLLPH